MRDRTQARIEELARERGSAQVDLKLVEAGIEIGLKTMAEMVEQQRADSEPAEQRSAEPAAARCPAVRATDPAVRPPDSEPRRCSTK